MCIRDRSSSISKLTAKTGIVATAKAAITGVVNDWSIRIKKAPIPNPDTPITKPFDQLADLTFCIPSMNNQIIKIKINENTFRAIITLTTSQSFNKYSAAGKPVAKSSIEKTQRKFDVKTDMSLPADSFEADILIVVKS